MKLTLKNFRCWENETFDFEGKLNLLSGKSGSGKSSILSAILFVLFGTGQKIITQGKTTCKVTLELNKENIIIERTKKPNRLTLKTGDNQYEDDIAQEIINKKFGRFFDTISYIQQDMFNSFVYLSATDKLAFLEQFAFSGIDLKTIKQKNKELINQRYEQLLISKSKVDTTEALLKEQQTVEKVEFPFELYSLIFNKKVSKSANIDLLIKNVFTRFKNNNINLNTNKKLLEKEKDNLNEYKLYKQQLDIYTNKKLKLDKEIKDIKESVESVEDIENKLNKCKADLTVFLKHKEHLNKKAEYEKNLVTYNQLLFEEERKKEEELTLLKKDKIDDIKSIKTKLLNLQSNLQKQKEKEQIIKEKEAYFVNEDELSEMKNELQSILEKIRIKKEFINCYKCPKCDSLLKLIEGSLKLSNIVQDKVELDLKDLTKIKDDLEVKINKNSKLLDKYNYIVSKLKNYEEEYSIKELSFDIKNLETIIEKQNEITNRIHTLETTENNTLKKLKAKLDQDLKIIQSNENKENLKEKLKENLKEGLNESELREAIFNLEQDKFYSQTKFKLQKELKETETKLQSLKFDKTEDDILTCIKDLEIKIENLEKENISVEKAIKVIEKYKEYLKNKERIDDIENRLEKYKLEEKQIESKYTSAKLLKEKILEAESIAIISTIENINTHAQLYLDTFFSDYPISVTIISFKEDLKGNSKAQINMKVEYKGMECDFTSLSGGERQRISLAFTLALSEIFNSPLLLLDECTSNLDQESTSNIISSIKENYKGSLAILACHQVVTGIFDNTISL